MKNFKKLVCVLFAPSILLISCGGGNPGTRTFTITFHGENVSFPIEQTAVLGDKNYSIITTSPNGYKMSQNSFAVKLNNQNVDPGATTWHWSDNVLSFDKAMITGNIDVTAKSEAVTFDLIHEFTDITCTSDLPATISPKEDLVITFSANNPNKNVYIKVQIDNIPSNKYEISSTSKTDYTFKIKKEDICGDTEVVIASFGDDICVDKEEISMITYDNDALSYVLPGGASKEAITVESSNPSLFTVRQDKDNRIVYVESNLTNNAGDGQVIFKNNGNPIKKIPVYITYPSNFEEAMNAFTLAAMKINNGATDQIPFDVKFNFNNTHGVYDDDGFNNSLEIYGRRGAFDAIYSTGIGKTNRFTVKTSQEAGNKNSGISKTDKNYYFNNLTNLNYNYRKQKEGYNRNFYIDYALKTLEVENSDELFWAVEHHYQPIIHDHNLQIIYNKAKAICASSIEGEVDGFYDARSLFDRLNSITHYDHYVVSSQCTLPWYSYSSYFLEGIFNDVDNDDDQYDGVAVCDGFSKAYALLCGIVGIPCIRSYGFAETEEGTSGHAWNYVYEYKQGLWSWYLCCPTWCKLDDNSGALSKIFDYNAVSIMNYTSFMASKNYFEEQSRLKFSDLAFPDTVQPHTSDTSFAGDKSILSEDHLGQYSYNLTSDMFAKKVKEVARTATNNSYICLSVPNNHTEQIDSWMHTIASGTPSGLSCYGLFLEEDNFISCWLLFKAE